jgi:hypothetical protein
MVLTCVEPCLASDLALLLPAVWCLHLVLPEAHSEWTLTLEDLSQQMLLVQ